MSEEFWSDACQEAWLNAHNFANENNSPGVLTALLTLFVAMQQVAPQDKLVLRVYLKLRAQNSPIYLLARKPDEKEDQFFFPIVKDGQIFFKRVANQLFVQLETSAQHDSIVKDEWNDPATHNLALIDSGFYLPPAEIAHCKVFK